jgi:hypothetical protein
MERQTHAMDVMSALHVQSEDDTIEIRILRPHEAYRKNLAACAPDAVERAATKRDDASS